MLNALRNFLNKAQVELGPVAPEAPFAVIGDIHGRADLLSQLLDQLPNMQIVCVGDYVDRGDQSADVLHLLHERPDILCLSGNHEDMMLRFIDAPEKGGGRWLLHGGLQTLQSFGLSSVSPSARADTLIPVRDALVEALGKARLSWLRSLPSVWTSGNIAVVHAGANPAKPVAEQTPQILRWGHPDFFKTPRNDGIWVVHGHTIVEEPSIIAGRIAIDTGAYATGHLTAAIIEPDNVTFHTT
jgi:serine/threonine protein phosphatase 1